MKWLSDWQRAVIKVGSALIAPEGNTCSTRYALAIADFILWCRENKKEIIIVSSGSVAAGRSQFPAYREHSKLTIVQKQALAAIGQKELLTYWQRFFDFPCAQILLTIDDIHQRQRYINARNTLQQLLDMRVLPIVNENDSVATDELKVGDNDNLAAYVAAVSHSDLLVICSDVDGLYSDNPKVNIKAKHIDEVSHIDADIFAMASGDTNHVGTGGMRTKIQAAQKATERGINTLIVNGFKATTFEAIKSNRNPGTFFHRARTPRDARKHWLYHSCKSNGTLIIDDGAEKALQLKGASLLSSGIIDVTGRFLCGDVVDIVNKRQELIAKGVVQFDASELDKIKGQAREKLEKILGYSATTLVIHRNDMALTMQKE